MFACSWREAAAPHCLASACCLQYARIFLTLAAPVIACALHALFSALTLPHWYAALLFPLPPCCAHFVAQDKDLCHQLDAACRNCSLRIDRARHRLFLGWCTVRPAQVLHIALPFISQTADVYHSRSSWDKIRSGSSHKAQMAWIISFTGTGIAYLMWLTLTLMFRRYFGHCMCLSACCA